MSSHALMQLRMMFLSFGVFMNTLVSKTTMVAHSSLHNYNVICMLCQYYWVQQKSWSA